MPTPFESATLNLRLFELRRDPLLREARNWWLMEFHPDTVADVVAAINGPHNTHLRMVIGYWDMAASLVTTGAIDADAFRAAHGEIFGMFSKIQPFLAELRAQRGEAGLCQNLETVVMGAPDAEGILNRRRAALRAYHEKMQAAAKTAS